MKYIIEHMDPELWEWSQIEYRHISDTVSKQNLIITSLKQKDLAATAKYCDARTESVSKLGFKRVCVLDPEAEKTLAPSDKNTFDYLVFGGILGNDPPEARTRELVVPGSERRNLGKEQFSTDNAVMVAKKIIDGTPLEKLKFMHDLTIEVDDGEEIILPFKYLLVDGKPFVASEIIEYVKKHGF
jgi:ribosome biogenesis SPOUT family RNA methylase Rps3